jgi:hypothetical protein
MYMCSALGVVDGDQRQNAEDDDQHDHGERVPPDVAVLYVERRLEVLLQHHGSHRRRRVLQRLAADVIRAAFGGVLAVLSF